MYCLLLMFHTLLVLTVMLSLNHKKIIIDGLMRPFALQTVWSWKYYLEMLDSWSGKVSTRTVLGELQGFQWLLLNHSWQAADWYNAIERHVSHCNLPRSNDQCTPIMLELLAYNYQELYQAMTSAPLYNSYPTFVFSTTTNCICKKKRGGGGVSGGFFFLL